jgi:glycosyltransferase involved in cell wall biosynthesis
MSVLFCHDHRFVVAADGVIYSRGQYSEAIVSRYEAVFGPMSIAGRTMPAPDPFDPTRLNRVFDGGSRFIPIANLSSPRALLFGDAAARRQLEWAIEQVDAVVVRLPSEVGLLAGNLARRQGKPVVTEVVACVRDGLASHSGVKARVYAPVAQRRTKRAVARSDWTLYVTEHFLQDRYPSRGDQVSVSNVQLPERDEALLAARLGRIQTGPLVLGMIAALFHDEKRVDVAIEAMARAIEAGADLRLEIVGPGETRSLEAIAASLGVADRVRFVGPLTHGRPLFSFLDGVDLYIQTSFQEGLPRGVIEAMSRALPALGSNVGGTNELLPREWLHTPGDVAALKGQILRLADPTLRSELARANFARAADFTPDKLDARRGAFWRRFLAAHGVDPLLSSNSQVPT